ncbi:head GIN domain-containing protein [Emticicia sp. SJ17W-69]|uniref:head GIN domain-containing protein n=1 Tax=Emticicia sp. SJ17W-69 TaxID=3421657 RepID=UPI003EBC88C6
MKKNNLISVLMILVMIFSITSCGILQQAIEPADEKQKTFDVKNFDRLEMGNSFHINVVQGATFKIKASGDSRDIDDLLVEENNGKLEISFRNKWRLRRYRMDIDIEMPALKEVDFSGASVSNIRGFDNLSDLKIDLSGASKSVFQTNAKTYDIDLSGASTLELEGKSQKIYAELSGASTLNAFSNDAEEASLNLSGASSGRVNVAQQLKVRASGASKVRYRGNAKVDSDLSGSSKVEKE